MRKNFVKIVILLILYICSFRFLFYTNSTEYKIKHLKNKYNNEIIQLKPTYNKVTKHCITQNFANRGSYTACMEEKIKNTSAQNYKFYLTIENLCEDITDNLADKSMCIDAIVD